MSVFVVAGTSRDAGCYSGDPAARGYKILTDRQIRRAPDCPVRLAAGVYIFSWPYPSPHIVRYRQTRCAAAPRSVPRVAFSG